MRVPVPIGVCDQPTRSPVGGCAANELHVVRGARRKVADDNLHVGNVAPLRMSKLNYLKSYFNDDIQLENDENEYLFNFALNDSLVINELTPSLAETAIKATTSTLSIVTASWALRSGPLVATLLTSLPVWKGFDPLPVLKSSESAKDKNNDDITEKLFDKETDENQKGSTED